MCGVLDLTLSQATSPPLQKPLDIALLQPHVVTQNTQEVQRAHCLHQAFHALHMFQQLHGRLPKPWDPVSGPTMHNTQPLPHWVSPFRSHPTGGCVHRSTRPTAWRGLLAPSLSHRKQVGSCAHLGIPSVPLAGAGYDLVALLSLAAMPGFPT